MGVAEAAAGATEAGRRAAEAAEGSAVRAPARHSGGSSRGGSVGAGGVRDAEGTPTFDGAGGKSSSSAVSVEQPQANTLAVAESCEGAAARGGAAFAEASRMRVARAENAMVAALLVAARVAAGAAAQRRHNDESASASHAASRELRPRQRAGTPKAAARWSVLRNATAASQLLSASSLVGSPPSPARRSSRVPTAAAGGVAGASAADATSADHGPAGPVKSEPAHDSADLRSGARGRGCPCL